MNTTDFFPMTSSLAIGPRNPTHAKSMDLFKNELHRRMELKMIERQEDGTTEPNYKMIPTSVIDFGPESYLTPRRSVRDCESSLDPPTLRRKFYCGRNIHFEDSQERLQTALIVIPSIGSKRDNRAISTLSRKTTLFRLQPRAERTNNVPPSRLRRKFDPQDTPDFCLRRQTKNTNKSKEVLNTLQAGKLSYEQFPLFGNL